MSFKAGKAGAPHWAEHQSWFRYPIPTHLKTWLLDSGSLTDRLKQASDHSFAVRVLAEGWRRPRLDEALKLNMRSSEVGWVREVQLLCDGEPRVFARTVIPAHTLTGDERRLTALGTRPLGAALFAKPGMQRGVVELARVEPHQAMYAEAVRCLQAPPQVIWGRRSIFRISGKPLMVTELFLPGI